MTIRAYISGVGSYLPERILSNHDLTAWLDTSDEWILARTGIHQRHIAADNELASDLATKAAQRALDDASCTINDIDALIVATATPDRIFPSTAVITQHKLGGRGFPAWDVQAACSGFIYAVAQAQAFLAAGMYRRILLIGVETMSRIMDWKDRSTCILFGDGAGAIVLEAADADANIIGGLLGSVLHADGQYTDLLSAKCPLPPASPNHPGLLADQVAVSSVSMRGNEVFRVAVTKLGEVVNEILIQHGLQKTDIDLLIPHQANIRIINATARKLNMDISNVAVTVAKHANTSSASVPLALDVMYRTGRLQKNDLLLFEAFGAGFVWGANLVRWSK
ncbi:MAG: beta-ketoacyl-ACP synthase III [Mariprofundales bacterium]